MDKTRVSEVWTQIVSAHDATTVVGDHGRTGNPNDTLDMLFASGVTAEETRQVLAIQAKIRPHDLRFDTRVREWLYRSLDESVSDWYDTYAKCLKDIDKIHPAHMNGLARVLRERMETKA